MKMILASGNKKKLRELREIMEPFGFSLLPQAEAGVEGEAEETGTTFLENAMLKAEYALRATGLPSVADDSGLEVEALSGAPGVYSARYAPGDDMDRLYKVLGELRDVEDGKRGARFVSVIALALPDGRRFHWEGTCDGIITREPAGEQGFGYDPIFYVPAYQRTFAELSPEEKNAVSHRGRALEKMKEQLKEIFHADK